MNHLFRYEGYNTQERLNDVLDKITKYGIKSLTTIEKEFLDSHSTHRENEVHDKIKEDDQVFEDDFGRFKFEYKETQELGDQVHHLGTLYVPDLELGNGRKISGRIDGRIIVYQNGQTALEFEKDGYDVFDFCNGLEYELDSFVDYIDSELEKK
jgi:hypothetical protein